jgi:precorrin-6B methylase 2
MPTRQTTRLPPLDQCAGPDRILDIGFAFRKSKVLLSAVELDLFTILGSGALDGATLAHRLAIQTRGSMEFFDALVTLGLLDRDAAGRYISPPDCARYLNRSSADYIGGILEHLNSRMYGTWSKLGSALRSGLPQSGALGDGGYTALYETELALDHFLRAMTASSMLVATSLAAAFPWNSVRSFADIGAAQGCVACEIAKAHPHLTGIGFDLPQVGTAFTRYVAERSLTQRLAFAAGDFMTDDLPSADVLILGRILHNWGDVTKARLLAKARHALPVGGHLIVYDPMLDESRSSGPALFAGLTMLLETTEGREYSVRECHDWLAEAGFGELQVIALDRAHVAILGRKA